MLYGTLTCFVRNGAESAFGAGAADVYRDVANVADASLPAVN